MNVASVFGIDENSVHGIRKNSWEIKRPKTTEYLQMIFW